MAKEKEPVRKSRLCRSSSVSEIRTCPQTSTSRGIIAGSSGALVGVLACVAIAVYIPQLYPQLAEQELQPIIVTEHSNDTIPASTLTLERRSNETIEAALEAAVMGAFLADAASLGLHGLYDAEKMMALLEHGEDAILPPEFHKPLNLEYKGKKGSFSAYAYEVLPLLHTLLGQNKLETETFRTDMLAFLSGFKGHITDAMRDFKVNAEQGLQGNEAASNKKHANSLVKVPLIVARYGGEDALMGKVAVAVQLQQSDDDALLAAHLFAAILERLTVYGGSLQEALAWAGTGETGLSDKAQQWTQDVLSKDGSSAVDGAREIGIGQGAEEVLKSGLHVALNSEDYVGGVRQSILAGGDTTSRAHVVGALLGPLHGDKTFPGDWLKKAVKYTDVKQMVHVVIVQRKTLVPFHINRDPAQQPQPE